MFVFIWVIDALNWCLKYEYDHMKGNDVHMLYCIQIVWTTPLEQFKDIIHDI